MLPATILASGWAALSRRSSGRDVGQCQVTVSPATDTVDGGVSISSAGKTGSLVSVYLSLYLVYVRHISYEVYAER